MSDDIEFGQVVILNLPNKMEIKINFDIFNNKKIINKKLYNKEIINKKLYDIIKEEKKTNMIHKLIQYNIMINFIKQYNELNPDSIIENYEYIFFKFFNIYDTLLYIKNNNNNIIRIICPFPYKTELYDTLAPLEIKIKNNNILSFDINTSNYDFPEVVYANNKKLSNSETIMLIANIILCILGFNKVKLLDLAKVNCDNKTDILLCEFRGATCNKDISIYNKFGYVKKNNEYIIAITSYNTLTLEDLYVSLTIKNKDNKTLKDVLDIKELNKAITFYDSDKKNITLSLSKNIPAEILFKLEFDINEYTNWSVYHSTHMTNLINLYNDIFPIIDNYTNKNILLKNFVLELKNINCENYKKFIKIFEISKDYISPLAFNFNIIYDTNTKDYYYESKIHDISMLIFLNKNLVNDNVYESTKNFIEIIINNNLNKKLNL